MTVLCANCQTENRDRAMFCIGCAGKLPAFAATGPSALAALGPQAGPRGAAPGRHAAGGARGGRAARGMLLAVLLLGATVVALLAWIGLGLPRSAPPALAPTPSAVTAAAPAPVAAPVAAPVPAPVPEPPVQAAVVIEEPAPPTEAPEAPEAASVNTTAGPAEPATVVAPTRPVRNEAPAASRRAVAVSSAPPGRGAADPRVGCEQLFFVLAARCEANHCEQAAYARHPRCSVVRAQRQRDEARRNLTQ